MVVLANHEMRVSAVFVFYFKSGSFRRISQPADNSRYMHFLRNVSNPVYTPLLLWTTHTHHLAVLATLVCKQTKFHVY